MSKIGIFGGTFNPVHLGHTEIARCVVENTDVEKIIFLPTANPHYKNNTDVVSPFHRYNMLLIATENEKNIEISDYEIKKNENCYTVDTMRYFKKMHPENEYCFIIGADSLNYLHKWYDAENLIKENEFIVVDRNFKDVYDFDENIIRIKNIGGNVQKVSMKKVDISSSMVREIVSKRGDLSAYTHKGVWEYILCNNLYIGRNTNDD